MPAVVAAPYKSGAQRTRVVTEAWGENNLYCPNCSSPTLKRLSHNTKASDFSCPNCKFWYQLKGQKTAIRNTITDGAYESMMDAIRSDRAPNYFFLHYELTTWSIQNLILIPHFAFPPSAIIKRPPLSPTARRAGWVGCNFALNRIPLDARIPVVRDRVITPISEVRAAFRRVKPLSELPVNLRGWTLDVLNIIRRITSSKFRPHSRPHSLNSQPSTPPPSSAPTMGGTGDPPVLPVRKHVGDPPTRVIPSDPSGESPAGTGQWPVLLLEFSNADLYAFEQELKALHPGNFHIRDKIRQQLQVLRDHGLLRHLGRNRWSTILP